MNLEDEICEMPFSQEEVWELDRQEIAREVREEGLRKGRQETAHGRISQR